MDGLLCTIQVLGPALDELSKMVEDMTRLYPQEGKMLRQPAAGDYCVACFEVATPHAPVHMYAHTHAHHAHHTHTRAHTHTHTTTLSHGTYQHVCVLHLLSLLLLSTAIHCW